MAESDDERRSLLGRARRYREQGRIGEAIELYELALSRWPDSPNTWYNLGLLQRQAGNHDRALECYRQALQRRIGHPEEVHLNRAVVFSNCLQRPAEAERELAAALRLRPTYIPALFNLANLHEDLGRRDAAAAAYERILALQPGNLEALARYARLRKFSDPADPLIARLRGAVASANARPAELASVGFELGRALDACGEYDAAWEAYGFANRCSRESAGGRFVPYDASAHEQLIDRIIAAFPSAPVTAPAESPAAAPRPIFICGMFRSGSTLLEQLLAGHPRIQAAGELDLIPDIALRVLAPYPEGCAAATPERLRAVAGGYLSGLARRLPGAELATDKRPDNFLYLGLIKRLFPAAKIVHTTREPLDNCLSVYFLNLDQRMSYALDLMDTGHYYRQYARLMSHWKSLFARDIHDIHYDTLVRTPEPVMARLLEFLGLEWNDRCLDVKAAERPVKTASVWQVREPLYQHSSGRAGHYGRQLSQLRAYLDRCSYTARR